MVTTELNALSFRLYTPTSIVSSGVVSPMAAVPRKREPYIVRRSVTRDGFTRPVESSDAIPGKGRN
jgi:hypothetical protein